jgi:hypothetical protein
VVGSLVETAPVRLEGSMRCKICSIEPNMVSVRSCRVVLMSLFQRHEVVQNIVKLGDFAKIPRH